jgi:glutathione synthase/RimK-type ligase-like ATP-grasp enzyme
VFLWRLSENVAAATKPLALALETLAPLINSTATREICSDKWATYRTLAAAGVPVLDTMWLAPGAQVPHLGNRTVVKPAGGAGGRDVRIATADDRIDAATRESWIAQPYVGSEERHLRVLVIGGSVVTAYGRTAASDHVANNIEAGGSRIAARDAAAEALALDVASLLQAGIAGVDLVPDPWRVLEVNSSPGIPPDAIDAAAEALAALLDASRR